MFIFYFLFNSLLLFQISLNCLQQLLPKLINLTYIGNSYFFLNTRSTCSFLHRIKKRNSQIIQIIKVQSTNRIVLIAIQQYCTVTLPVTDSYSVSINYLRQYLILQHKNLQFSSGVVITDYLFHDNQQPHWRVLHQALLQSVF